MKKQLKEFLNSGKIEDIPQMLNFMVDHIGDPDPLLRDQLIYRGFAKLITEERLSTEQMNQLLSTLIGEPFYLYRIGEIGTDSVFQRSFSALVVALLLEFDQDKHQLNKELVQEAFRQAIHYVQHEQDRRGYVEDKGWAHGIAHGADALEAAAKHPDFNDNQIMLNSIRVPLLSGHSYMDDEEERLAISVASLLRFKQADHEVLTWIQQLVDHSNQLKPDHTGDLTPYRVQQTVKRFLQSLYFLLIFKDQSIAVRKQISVYLKEWSYY